MNTNDSRSGHRSSQEGEEDTARHAQWARVQRMRKAINGGLDTDDRIIDAVVDRISGNLEDD